MRLPRWGTGEAPFANLFSLVLIRVCIFSAEICTNTVSFRYCVFQMLDFIHRFAVCINLDYIKADTLAVCSVLSDIHFGKCNKILLFFVIYRCGRTSEGWVIFPCFNLGKNEKFTVFTDNIRFKMTVTHIAENNGIAVLRKVLARFVLTECSCYFLTCHYLKTSKTSDGEQGKGRT